MRQNNEFGPGEITQSVFSDEIAEQIEALGEVVQGGGRVAGIEDQLAQNRTDISMRKRH